MPRIGLLSDSHGRASTTRRAVAVLMERRVDLLVHLGDVGSLEVIDELLAQQPAEGGGESFNPPVYLTFGNVDWDRDSMARYAEHLGMTVADPVGYIELGDERRLAYTHGDDTAAMQAALGAQPAFLCHGHSHRTRDVRIGDTHVVNPGALFRARRYTVAVLDTDADRAEFFDVTEQPASPSAPKQHPSRPRH